jgi:DNA-binding PadR family transcriptional regulator
LVGFVNAYVESLTKAADARARINAGIGTFEDRWNASKGSVEGFATQLPIIGQYLETFNRYMSDYEPNRIADEGRGEASRLASTLDRQLELARATTDEQRELIRLKHAEWDLEKQLLSISRKTGEDYKAQQDAIYKITELGRQRLADTREQAELDKSIADYTKQQAESKAQAASGDSFYDMVEAEQIKALRRFGLNEEADARDINLDVAKRHRDLENDPTVNTRDPELMRRKLLVSMLAALEGEKPNPDDNAQNIGVGSIGSASLLGQFFAPGAMNEQKREQKKLGDTAQAILKQIEIIARKRDNPSIYN